MCTSTIRYEGSKVYLVISRKDTKQEVSCRVDRDIVVELSKHNWYLPKDQVSPATKIIGIKTTLSRFVQDFYGINSKEMHQSVNYDYRRCMFSTKRNEDRVYRPYYTNSRGREGYIVIYLESGKKKYKYFYHMSKRSIEQSESEAWDFYEEKLIEISLL